MANIKSIITIGAIVGTFLGTLATYAYPKRQRILTAVKCQTNDLTELAKEYKEILLEKGRYFSGRRVVVRESYWKGGIIGIILGAGAVFLTTPKSGKQMRSHINKSYLNLIGKTDEIIRSFKNNSTPFTEVSLPIKKRKRLIKPKLKTYFQ